MPDRRVIRVVVVDDHPLVREGLIHVFQSSNDIDVVGQGETAQDASELARSLQPDILILDLSIPGTGMKVLTDMAGSNDSHTKVLVLTVSDDEADVLKAFRLGAKGYALKGIGGRELCEAVRSLNNSGEYVSPQLGGKILGRGSLVEPDGLPDNGPGLTGRERQIVSLVAQGYSNREIAAALELSEKTVKHYLTGLFRKLHVRSRLELGIAAQSRQDLQSSE